MSNPKAQLRDLFVKHLLAMFGKMEVEDEETGEVKTVDRELKAADLEVVRKVIVDPNFTFESVQAGKFGDTAKAAAEDFPFPDDGREEFQAIN